MYNVMVVDDSDVMRMEIKRLKVWKNVSNFQIIEEAENGEEALEKLRGRHMDLLLLDIHMPIINGIELLKLVTEESLSKVVVFISDYSCFEYARQGMVLGAFDFLVKPVDKDAMADLLIRVQQKLEKTNQVERIKDTEIDIIAEAFIQGEDSALIMAQKMFDYKIAGASGEKSIFQMLEAYRAIVDKVTDKVSWLEKFISKQVDSELLMIDDDEYCIELCISRLEELGELIKFAHVPKEENQLVRKTLEYILENIDDDMNLNHIAERLYINRTYLSELFKKKTGRPVSDHIAFLKVERAKYLMTYESLRNYEVAYKLGYKDGEYLSKIFKRITGLTPREYRSNVLERRK